MLIWAVALLGAALLAGTGLALPHLRGSERPPPRWLALVHLVLGLSGLALLILASAHPERDTGSGTAGFGTIAIVMTSLAALIGVGFLLARGRLLPGALIGLHATMAVGGFVVLLAYALAG